MGRPVKTKEITLKRAGWLRRNARPLVAVVVLLPATLGIMFANQWLGYVDQRPTRPMDVAAGETLDYGNAHWRVEETDRVPGDSAAGRERDLPAGTDLMVVTVRVDPTGPGPDGKYDGCTVRLEESGGNTPTRSWTNGGAISLDGSGPTLASCSSELGTPYTFDAQFVVPRDAGESSDFTLGISVVTELPEYARFALD
jgi:hypothetical protein